MVQRDNNSDLNEYRKRIEAGAERIRRQRELQKQYGFVKEKEETQLRIKAQGIQTANNLVLEPDEKKSFLDKLTNIVDTPSRVFTRPLMGAMLSGIYRALPGEQAGEKELREAAKGIGYNPANIFFNKQTAEDLRGALKETKLPWGVYTAMEIGLDPIAFVPVGRIASPGIKATSKLLRKTGAISEKKILEAPKVIKSKTKRKRVFDNSTIEELENGLNLAEPGWLQTKIASPLGKLPVFKQVLGAVNPSSLVDTEVGKSTLALGMANETAKSLADIAVSFVGRKGKSPFTIDDNGMAKLIDKQGRTIDKAWGDVFQNPKAVARYLTKDQKDYIKEYQDIVAEVADYATEHGIKLNKIGLGPGERFIPRQVLERNGFEKIVNLSKRPHANRSAFEKSRYYQTMEEGIQNGVKYYNDPLGVLRKHVEAVYKVDAENQYIKRIKGMGVDLTSPELSRAKGAKRSFDNKIGALAGIQKELGNFVSPAAIAALKLSPDMPLSKQFETLKRLSQTRSGFKNSSGAARSDLALQKIASQFNEVSTMRAGKQKTEALAKLKDAIDKEVPILRTEALKAQDAINKAQKSAAGRMQREGKETISKAGGRWFDRDEVISFERMNSQTQRGAAAEGLSRVFSTVGGAGRAITAGLDFGGAMIQGFPTLVTRPRTWAVAQKNAFNALLNPKNLAEWKAKNAEKLARMARYTGALSRSEYFEGAERGLGLGALPVLRTFLDHAGAGFNAFGDVARLQLFESMEPMVRAKVSKMALKQNLTADSPRYAEMLDRQLTELGGHVSKMTGTVANARLGIGATQAEIERGLLFAPRYLRATVGLMADVINGNIRGTLARDTMAGMLSGGLIYYYGLALATGSEPKLDPTKGDFMTVEFEGNRVGFGGAWVSLAKQLSKIYSQTDEIIGGEEELSKLMSIHKPDDSSIGKYVRYKTTPFIGLGWDMVTGRDALGRTMPSVYDDPMPFVGEGMKRFLPFSVQGLFDEGFELEGDDWEQTTSAFAGDFFGLRAFPSSAWELSKLRKDELARANGAEDWDTLDPLRKRLILEKDSELAELQVEMDKFNQRRPDEMQTLIKEYQNERENARKQYIEDLSQYENDWREKGYAGKEYRYALDRAAAKLGTRYEDIYAPGSRFAPALAELRRDSEEGDSLPLEQAAADEFIMRLVIGVEETDANGNRITLEDEFDGFNYSEYERRIEDMKSRYGEAIYNNVKLRFDKSAELPPMARELKELRDLFSPYWKVGETIAEQYGILDTWIEYKSTTGSVRGDELELQNPLLKQIKKQESQTRIDMRSAIPLLDAFLLRYGYTTEIKNREVGQKGKEFVQSISSDIQETFPLDIK